MFRRYRTKLCKHCNRTAMLVNRIYLWFLRRILKITLCEIMWFLLVLFVFIIWSFRNENSVEKVQSNHPLIIWWTQGFPGTNETIKCPNNIQCNVFSDRNLTNTYKVHGYLFYGSNINFEELPLPRNPEIIWGLYHEESPRNVEELMHEPVLKLFNYSSTYSRYSDVPFPLQHLESFHDITTKKYFVETREKNSLLETIAPVLYLQSDCVTSTERDSYVATLMEHIQIDSYGTCLNNKKLPEKFSHDYLNNLNEESFLKFVARYKFVIAIENGVCNDYVTEKFWRAIKVGSVPIYFGSPSIKLWLPNPKSAILLEDFPTPKILSDHLNLLLKNDNLYEEYLDHKINQVVSNARLIKEYEERPYQFNSLKTIQKFQCLICNKVHETNKNTGIKVVDKSHYDCPKPLSALEQNINPENSWVQSWEYKRKISQEIYKNIIYN